MLLIIRPFLKAQIYTYTRKFFQKSFINTCVFKKTEHLYRSTSLATSSTIEIDQEYFMYDMVSVVSSIGGGIGIFLGYSCFGIFSSAIKKLFNRLK